MGLSVRCVSYCLPMAVSSCLINNQYSAVRVWVWVLILSIAKVLTCLPSLRGLAERQYSKDLSFFIQYPTSRCQVIIRSPRGLDLLIISLVKNK